MYDIFIPVAFNICAFICAFILYVFVVFIQWL